jgi:hypothetical protein
VAPSDIADWPVPVYLRGAVDDTPFLTGQQLDVMSPGSGPDAIASGAE